MSARIPAPEAMDALRDHFRKLPPSTPRDFKFAGLRAGVTQAAAMRAWSRGWPPNVEAIEQQLARERELARQSMDVLRAERLVTSAKANAAVLQNEMRRLVPAVKALTDNLLSSVADLGDLPPEAAIKALQRFAKVQKDVCAVTAKSVELDRLLAGEATSIVGHRTVEPEGPVDLDRAKATRDALTRAIARHERAAAAAKADKAITVAAIRELEQRVTDGGAN